MLPAIKGVYDNGKITLAEEPPVKTVSQVMVIFLTEDKNQLNKIRIPGGLKGRITLPENFNEPLEDLKEYE